MATKKRRTKRASETTTAPELRVIPGVLDDPARDAAANDNGWPELPRTMAAELEAVAEHFTAALERAAPRIRKAFDGEGPTRPRATRTRPALVRLESDSGSELHLNPLSIDHVIVRPKTVTRDGETFTEREAQITTARGLVVKCDAAQLAELLG